MKPDTREAMRGLIWQIKRAIPFDLPESYWCTGGCRGCSKKLVEFLATEIESWDNRLDRGEVPRLGDINNLASSSRKIRRVLEKNGVLQI